MFTSHQNSANPSKLTAKKTNLDKSLEKKD